MNMKMNHAVFTFSRFHILNDFSRDHFCTAPVYLNTGIIYATVLTVGFTKHNKMSAAFTTLELDGISTELTTARQNKPTYLYNELWEVCQI